MEKTITEIQTRARSPRGFTIVELLIVIVVIAILAAISIIAYTGIQQRANNTARINAVTQVVRSIIAYKTAYDAYPSTGGGYCLTVDNICSNWNGTEQVTGSNAALVSEIAKVSTLPQSVPRQAGTFYGIHWNYGQNRTVAGDPNKKLLVMYWLEGNAQDCGVPGVVTDGRDTTYPLSTTGYTATEGNRTNCWVGV